MREILFKAKQKDWRDLPKESWWIEGYYAMMGKGNLIRHYIVQNCALTGLFSDPEENMYFNDVEIDPEALCQYTGLKDKNGNRIWENDIVRIKNSMDEGIGNIEFYGGMWYVDGEPSNSLHDIVEYDDGELEVIGNIFDTPELLKGGLTCRN